MARPHLALLVPLVSLVAGACGDGGVDNIDPTDVRFGDTALVVIVNPVVNDANRGPVPAPGASRAGITLATDDGPVGRTGDDGVAVLAPMPSGIRTIFVSGGGIDASFAVTMGPGSLREVAIAADGPTAEVMVNLDYTADRIMELSPAMTNAQVNDALKVSDRVVFLTGGVYLGDLDFAGSRVTLFGEGVFGGTVTIQGNVTMSGSDSRIRGAHITGSLTVPASGTGLSFSRVDGTATVAGSDSIVLQSALCGGAAITGSGSFVVGNRGIAPATACP
jgi:hypothetical protein